MKKLILIGMILTTLFSVGCGKSSEKEEDKTSEKVERLEEKKVSFKVNKGLEINTAEIVKDESIIDDLNGDGQEEEILLLVKEEDDNGSTIEKSRILVRDNKTKDIICITEEEEYQNRIVEAVDMDNDGVKEIVSGIFDGGYYNTGDIVYQFKDNQYIKVKREKINPEIHHLDGFKVQVIERISNTVYENKIDSEVCQKLIDNGDYTSDGQVINDYERAAFSGGDTLQDIDGDGKIELCSELWLLGPQQIDSLGTPTYIYNLEDGKLKIKGITDLKKEPIEIKKNSKSIYSDEDEGFEEYKKIIEKEILKVGKGDTKFFTGNHYLKKIEIEPKNLEKFDKYYTFIVEDKSYGEQADWCYMILKDTKEVFVVAPNVEGEWDIIDLEDRGY